LRRRLALVGLGLLPPSPSWAPRSTVAVVLGAIGVALAGRDLQRFARPPDDPRHWWFHHMTGMLTSLVAAVTAFSAVNFTVMPTTVRWLWPTLIGIVGIVAWVRYYRTRFARRHLTAPGSCERDADRPPRDMGGPRTSTGEGLGEPGGRRNSCPAARGPVGD
jgi:hypothetical protein